MSGIAVVIGSKEDPLPRMMEKLNHRGPDGQITFKKGKVALGVDRFEVPGSNLPPLTSWNDYVIGMDGYISNHDELADQTDDEAMNNQEMTVLRLYEKHGPKALKKLRGMFALVITDGDRVIAARDAIGIKPLYYATYNGELYFASELKALLEIAEDSEGIAVKEFPPGYYYDSQTKKWHLFSKQFETGKLVDVAPAVVQEKLAAMVTKEIETAISDDAPVGLFLSGGLDSSLIAALAIRINGAPLPTFSVGTKESSDLLRARQVAEYIGSEHHEYIYDEQDITKNLADIIYHMESYDSRVIRPSLGNYLVSRLAAENGVKVVLSGEGADELFAGYAYMKNLDTDADVHKELERSMENLYKFACRRVDRMAAAHSVEVRTPFLNQDIINYALSLPVELKIHGEEKTEKWILRQSFADSKCLPDDILWRKKVPFNRGCGSDDILEELTDRWVSDTEYQQSKKQTKDSLIRNKEEYYYYKLFKEIYPQKLIEDNMGRWPLEHIC